MNSFQFSTDQVNAVNGICNKLLDPTINSHVLTVLTGSAGTGKTTVVGEIMNRIQTTNPNIKIFGIRPEIWPGIEGLKPLGSPEDIVPKILDESIVDEWIYITADEAKHWCHVLSKNGIFTGQSSGCYMAACSKLMEKIELGKIVTIFNDFGDRYFSAGLWR